MQKLTYLNFQVIEVATPIPSLHIEQRHALCALIMSENSCHTISGVLVTWGSNWLKHASQAGLSTSTTPGSANYTLVV